MKNKGFTLLELLVAVAIIGILAAIGFPNLRYAIHMSKLNTCKSNMKYLATAIEEYTVQKGGQYPNQLQDLIDAEILSSPSGWYCPTSKTTYIFNRYDPASPEYQAGTMFELICRSTVDGGATPMHLGPVNWNKKVKTLKFVHGLGVTLIEEGE
jgi:prepilin-type N-terminal cleavage/methylation domain-containing protein